MSADPRRFAPALGLHGAASGLRLPFEGLRILRRNRSLWVCASAPVVLAAAAVSTALALVVENAAAIHQAVAGWMPTPVAESWIAWLWVGPAVVALALLGGLLFCLAAGLLLLAALLVASVLSAPFLDVLSRRVEILETGSVRERAGSGLAGLWADGVNALWNELQRVSFFAAVSALLLLLGALVPGGQAVAPIAAVAFTLLYLPLDHTGYALDRQQVPFRRRRAWVRANLPVMAGFGSAGLLIATLPGLNLLLLPVFVTAGTLLVTRHPPEGLPTDAAGETPPSGELR